LNATSFRVGLGCYLFVFFSFGKLQSKHFSRRKSLSLCSFSFIVCLLLLPREPPSNEGRPSIRDLFVFRISSPREETQRVSLSLSLSRFFHFDFCWLARSHKECLDEFAKELSEMQ
jgi:hypothetical protein